MMEEELQVASKENLVEVKKKSKIDFKFVGIVAATLAVIVTLSLLIVLGTSKTTPKNASDKCMAAHEVYQGLEFYDVGKFKKYAVAVDNKECSVIGKNMFEKGGSAVDAAIASALCNSVMNAQSMGIGGGHFMNIYLKEKNKSYIIDARETAPENAFRDMFVNDTSKSRYGGLAAGIPGEIRGYHAAWQLGGKLPWYTLFEPTIDICLNGFKVSKVLASALKINEANIKKNQGLSSVFINKQTNKLYVENDVITMPKLAVTLSLIGLSNGSDIFYNGFLTDKMVQEINENGGNVTRNDFNNYNVRIHNDTFMIKLNDNLRMYIPPPPSSGILVSFIIRTMMGFNLQDEKKMTNEDKAIFYHRLLESFKHAYAKRTYLGDEEFFNSTYLTFVKSLYSDLQNQTYIDEIRSKINDQKTYPASYYGSSTKNWDHGTAHISVLAENGDAVSLTSTINNYFGAKFAGKFTGIIYNDIMDDFSTPGLTNSFGFVPSQSNFIMPNKRPMSSMSPLIVVDNKNDVQLILGASGGSKIISSIAQVAIKALFMNADIKTAIDSRRVHHQLSPEYAQIEAEFPSDLKQELEKRGHKLSCFNFGGSINQGIHRKDNLIYAYSDPRKGGIPAGE